MKLPEFFKVLDAHAGSVPLDVLTAELGKLDICCDDVGDCVCFGDDRYKRNLLRVTDAYAALILCWKPGQASPIHDHRGSACGIRVLRGEVTETRYDRDASGHLSEAGTDRYPVGAVCGSFDSDIHVICNNQAPGNDLVTLHIYTPPMREFNLYQLGSTEVGVYVDENMPVRGASVR